MTNFTKSLPLFVTIFVFNACRNIQPPTSPAETATIKGHVWIANWFENYVPPYSGIKVTLDGTNFSATTNDSGGYEFDGVPSGTYNVRFTKAGYGEIRWFGKAVQSGGNSLTYWDEPGDPEHLYHKPTLLKQPDVIATLRSLSISDTNIDGLSTWYLISKGSFVGTIPATYADLAIYFSHVSTVSSTPGHYCLFYCSNSPGQYWKFDTLARTFELDMPLQFVEPDGGFHSGDSIYVATYGAPYYGAYPPNDYFDPEIGDYVLTALNQTPSPVIGVKIP